MLGNIFRLAADCAVTSAVIAALVVEDGVFVPAKSVFLSKFTSYCVNLSIISLRIFCI